MAEPLKLLLADDHPRVVGRIRHGREGHHDVEIVGEATPGSALIDLSVRRRRIRDVLSNIRGVALPPVCVPARAMLPVASR